jgi:hypothetical protein
MGFPNLKSNTEQALQGESAWGRSAKIDGLMYIPH